jgi:pyrroline-5-carboxylate reductase
MLIPLFPAPPSPISPDQPFEMPYQLCVLGCGTMGVAVLSGVLDNLSSPRTNDNFDGAESGPSTPMGSVILDPNSNPRSLPDRSVPLESSLSTGRR